MGRIIALFALAKIVYLGIIAACLHFWGYYDGFKDVDIRWPEAGDPRFGSHFMAWDAAHYQWLSEHGYGRGVPSAAFYPLWPTCLRLVAFSKQAEPWVSLFLANAFSGIALGWLHFGVHKKWGGRVANLCSALVFSYPGALFLHFPYSEGLFLLCLAAVWNGMNSGNQALIAVGGLLIPLVRGNGAFVVLPIASYIVFNKVDCGESFSGLRQCARAIVAVPQRKLLWSSIAMASPFLGWLTYLFVMWFSTGNALEGFEAQRYWGNRHSVANMLNIPKFVMELFSPTTVHEFAGSLVDRIAFVYLLFGAYFLWRRLRTGLGWFGMLVLLPAMSGSFTSFVRFGCVAYPCFLGFAIELERIGATITSRCMIVSGMLAQVWLLWRFSNFEWAG